MRRGTHEKRVTEEEFGKEPLLDYSYEEEREESTEEMDVSPARNDNEEGEERKGKGKTMDGEEGQESGRAAHLTPEEQMDEEMRRMEEEEERRFAEEARRTEGVRVARASGRESGSAGVRAKIDQRYYYVQSLRAKIPPGRELNKDAGRRTGAEEAASGDDVAGFQGQDERWLQNYNIHSVERKVNVSCSFNPKSQLCYTCLGEPHRAWEGKGKEPVVVAISDEFFPANIPGMDGGDCIRVIRVEEGTLQGAAGDGQRVAGGSWHSFPPRVHWTAGEGGHRVLYTGVVQVQGVD